MCRRWVRSFTRWDFSSSGSLRRPGSAVPDPASWPRSCPRSPCLISSPSLIRSRCPIRCWRDSSTWLASLPWGSPARRWAGAGLRTGGQGRRCARGSAPRRRCAQARSATRSLWPGRTTAYGTATSQPVACSSRHARASSRACRPGPKWCRWTNGSRRCRCIPRTCRGAPRLCRRTWRARRRHTKASSACASPTAFTVGAASTAFACAMQTAIRTAWQDRSATSMPAGAPRTHCGSRNSATPLPWKWPRKAPGTGTCRRMSFSRPPRPSGFTAYPRTGSTELAAKVWLMRAFTRKIGRGSRRSGARLSPGKASSTNSNTASCATTRSAGCAPAGRYFVTTPGSHCA